MKATIKYKGNGLKPLPFPIIIIPQNCSENKATNVSTVLKGKNISACFRMEEGVKFSVSMGKILL